jgi:large subunit ribosomal protein L9
MDIILLDDIDKVGEKHEIVSVKPGYARNYLIPQGLAIVANDTNRGKLDEIKQKEAEELAARKAEFEAIAENLKDKVLKIGAKAGTSGKIFGSVTNVQIATALKDQFNVDVDRRKVVLPEEDIKTLGTYTAQLNMHPEVDIKVNFEVIEE